jgi:perosamine synthetase
MEQNFIPQMRPDFGSEEQVAVSEYLSGDVFITEFKHTEILEKMISDFTGIRHVIMTMNGTIALSLAGLALGMGPGDEVIVPNFTMIASANAFKMIGAKIVLVDIERKSLYLDNSLINNAISSRTKAIVLVNANGRYPNYDLQVIRRIADQHNLAIIEDSAQAIGCYYADGVHVGNFGDVSTLSFSAPKLISMGQGGAVMTNDDELAGRIRRLKDFGRVSGGTDIHTTIGFNFKITDLQAVVGQQQMLKLPSRIIRKKEIYNLYKKELIDVKKVELIYNDTRYTAPWFIEVLVSNREGLIKYLKSKGIGSRVMYPPINEQLAYGVAGNFPNSKLIGKRGLWLPSSISLTDSEIIYICDSIKDWSRDE